MKKTVLIIFIAIFIISNVFANPIDKKTALKVAENFYSMYVKSGSNLTLAYECVSKKHFEDETKQNEKQIYYYVFNSDNGFIIIAGDDAVYPVLGYSTESKFDANNKATNFKKWLENYKNQIRYVKVNNLKASEEIKDEWQNIIRKIKVLKSTNSVNPLVNVTWGQSPYVNDMCPYDANAGSGNGYHCVSGCPATAMAQIMKFWNYPEHGTGFHSYNHSVYGTLDANFGSTNYNWSSMPANVNSANSAVATLMYHCGVAVEMQYGPHESASYVIINASPTPEQCSEYAYKTYFGYDASSIQGVLRENYTDNQWTLLMKTELDAGRPIQYAGFGQGGHTFVCDGYDNSNYFHMNWGWAGMYDGFFLLYALNPGTGGTGGGAGTYNNGQQAVIGIKPPSGTSSDNIELFDDLTVSPNTIGYTYGFTVHTDFVNRASTTFHGDFGAAVFDADYNFVDFVEIVATLSEGLKPNYHYTNGMDFTTTGMLGLLPGTYHIAIFFRPTGGNWIIAGNGSYTNSVQLDVVNDNNIALYSNINVNTGDITQNQPVDVTVDIANFSTYTFNGTLSVNLYNLTDGSFVENIGVINNFTLNSNYHSGTLTFSSSGISAAPGTYLLTVIHKWDGSGWELTGSNNYTNPVKVIVRTPPLQADNYEYNDTQANARELNVSFSGNQASVLTTGSNIHVGSDVDFYKIELPSGYNYSISARIHDSNNSGNGQTYTDDVAWAYLHNGTWSDVYDDVMPGTFNVNNGGTVIFNVSPYFVGRTGTYLLDILINRTNGSGIVENEISNMNISVYPNPTNGIINIELLSEQSRSTSISITDITGKTILTKPNPKQNEIFDISNFKAGIYLIKVQTENKIFVNKIIKR